MLDANFRRPIDFMRPLATLAIAVSLLGGGPRDAAAQPSPTEIEGAKAAFFRALDLELASRWEEALSELTAVARVKTTPQVLFHIGLCQENLDRFLLARDSFERALAAAHEEGDAATEVLENAPARLSALEDRIPSLRIERDEGSKDVEIWVNGKALEESEFGKAIPRDPGSLRIEKSVGGKRTLVREVDLREGTHHLEKIAALPKALGALAPIAAGPSQKVSSDSDGITTKLPAIVVGSVGIGSAIASAICFGVSIDIQSEVEGHCANPDSGTGCDPAYRDLSGDGERLRTAGIALAAIAGASLATGAVLWFVLPDGSPPGKADLEPRVGVELYPTSIALHGVF